MQLLRSIEEKTDKAGDIGGDYVEHTAEYIRLQVLLRSSKLLSVICKLLIVSGLLVLAMVFLGVALSTWFSDLLDSKILGYLATSGVLLVLTTTIYFVKNMIDNLVVRKLSKII